MTTESPSETSLALLDNLAELSDGLREGRPGSREGLLDVCSRLVADLTHPSEAVLRLMWAQPTHLAVIRLAVDLKLFHALENVGDAGSTSAAIASGCAGQADPELVGMAIERHPPTPMLM